LTSHLIVPREAALREALRLSPPIPGRGVVSNEDTTLRKGKYAVEKDQLIIILQSLAHRDPEVWGEDVRPNRTE
jgi:cytochrome P450